MAAKVANWAAAASSSSSPPPPKDDQPRMGFFNPNKSFKTPAGPPADVGQIENEKE